MSPATAPYICGYDGEASDISVTRGLGLFGAWASLSDTLVAWSLVIYLIVGNTLCCVRPPAAQYLKTGLKTTEFENRAEWYGRCSREAQRGIT